MKKQNFKFFKFIVYLILALVLLRFLPIFLRAGQAIAVGVRAYWWAVLPAVFFGWALWKYKRRPRAPSQLERDVTRSVENQTGPQELNSTAYKEISPTI